MSEIPIEGGPLTEQQWAERRAATMAASVAIWDPEEGVLLHYQGALVTAVDENDVVVYPKSRRIGATWGIAAGAVLRSGATKSAGGMDTFYIGYNLDMAREFIDVCGMWAKNFATVASSVSEYLFKETDEKGADRFIQAYRIAFASGFEIVALASRPRSLRGRQGFVIIDEAAFHEDLEELIKAALALLIWGGKVLIISTHDGEENAFNELVKDCRSGKRPYKVIQTSFDEAIEQGLYRRICLVKGEAWTPEGEAAWRAKIRAFYGAGAAEELDVIPAEGGGAFLPLALIEARARKDIPVLRWRCDAKFVHLPAVLRTAAALAFCETEMLPALRRLDPSLRSVFGVDFARVGDLSVFWPLQIRENLDRRTPFTVELGNVPYDQQREILFYMGERLPRLSGGKLDGTGNGGALAEAAMQKWGASRIEMIHMSEAWYRDNMPRLKPAFEDGSFDIPAHTGTVDDFRSIRLVRGVPRVPAASSRAKGEDKDKATEQRHGDAAIAAAIALAAAVERYTEIGGESTGPRATSKAVAGYLGALGG